jgi:hypothetical protein
MTNGDSVVVLGSQIAAIIVALHTRGVLPAQTVLDELEGGMEFQPEHREVLQSAVVRVRQLADALGRFEPQCPNAIHQSESG